MNSVDRDLFIFNLWQWMHTRLALASRLKTYVIMESLSLNYELLMPYYGNPLLGFGFQKY